MNNLRTGSFSGPLLFLYVYTIKKERLPDSHRQPSTEILNKNYYCFMRRYLRMSHFFQ